MYHIFIAKLQTVDVVTLNPNKYFINNLAQSKHKKLSYFTNRETWTTNCLVLAFDLMQFI